MLRAILTWNRRIRLHGHRTRLIRTAQQQLRTVIGTLKPGSKAGQAQLWLSHDLLVWAEEPTLEVELIEQSLADYARSLSRYRGIRFAYHPVKVRVLFTTRNVVKIRFREALVEPSYTAPLPVDLLSTSTPTKSMPVQRAALDDGSGRQILLTDTLILGRTSAPDVEVIPSPRVSARHACVTWLGNDGSVRDLGSLNGTFLNGERLEPHATRSLAIADEIIIGDTVLRVVLAEAGHRVAR
jgi:hypothetical protein